MLGLPAPTRPSAAHGRGLLITQTIPLTVCHAALRIRGRPMIHLSRRGFLRTGVAATLATLPRMPAALSASPTLTPQRPLERLQPFPLNAVRLGPGFLNQQAQINSRY